MRRTGFTTIELIIVVIVMGLIVAMGIPRIRSVIVKTNVRSARVAFAGMAVRARAAAIQRGCTATLNFTAGAQATVWVTVCQLAGSGTQTLGAVDSIGQRFGVSVSSSSSSLQYDARGLSVGYQPVTVVFTASSLSATIVDSTMINQVGKVVH